MGCIGFLVMRINQVFNVSKTRAAVVAILCLVGGILLMLMNLGIFGGVAFLYALIYACIWFYKSNRDKKIVEQAQVRVRQAPAQQVSAPSRPRASRYYVPQDRGRR